MIRHTFVIVAYKDSEYLKDCLASLKNQKGCHSQIILCTSTPSDYISELAAAYGVTVYVRVGESNLKDDWNFAVSTAHVVTGADYVTIAHQDDIYHPLYAKTLYQMADHYPDMSLFCTRYATIDAEGRKIPGKTERVKRLLRRPLRMKHLSGKRFIKRLVLSFGNPIGCPTCTYNLRYTGIPLFRKPYHFVIDWDTLLRLSGEPGRFICIEKELLSYRVHSGAETRKNIVNHVREQEETAIYEEIWPKQIVRILMHFYKKAYKAYEH